jgi:hypothetical protein
MRIDLALLFKKLKHNIVFFKKKLIIFLLVLIRLTKSLINL